MTGFGLYIVIMMALGIILNFYYAGKGGVTHTPGVLIFAGIWATLNLLGVLFLGTGLGVF